MKRTLILSIMFLMMYGLLAAGALEPTAPPGPTMKTLDEVQPRIAINSNNTPGDVDYEYIISNSGSYYLTGDVSTTKGGIRVDADNVTIDLLGFSLIGSGTGTGSGIYMDGRTNVEVRNGTVRDFGGKGIYEINNSSKEHRVINVRALSNGDWGIYLYGIGNLVKDCTSAENGKYGISTSSGSTITGNTVYKNQWAGITAGFGCTITGNTVYENQSAGINANWGCTVSGNTAYTNQQSGISAGYGSTVIGNTSHGNQQHGISVRTGSTVIGNTSYNNQYYGIYLVDGNNLVDRNTAYLNNRAGGYSNISTCATCTLGVNHAP